jgi:NADH-quinone oxidoreductase subunit C
MTAQSNSTPKLDRLVESLNDRFGDALVSCRVAVGEVTIEVPHDRLLEVCKGLRDARELAFEQLMDISGVDYSTYGQAEWETDEASGMGFSRGVDAREAGRMGVTMDEVPAATTNSRRFAAAYHLLSVTHNWRLRVRCYAPDDAFPVLPSVLDIWNSANWYEREAFDLFGIIFAGHPDLRRILTDYGFIGHPFRKDFPLTGNVEMRYDPEQGRVIYQPVSIEPRVLVPRVIRHDNRYPDKADSNA